MVQPNLQRSFLRFLSHFTTTLRHDQTKRALGESARTFREFIVNHEGIDSHPEFITLLPLSGERKFQVLHQQAVLPQHCMSHIVYNCNIIA